MKNHTVSLIILLTIFICTLFIPASADDSEITVAINNETGLFIETISGAKAGMNPVSKESFSEINGAEIHQEDGNTTAVLPADQVYMVWLNNEEEATQSAYQALIDGINWNAELIQLFPAADYPTLVINPPAHFITQNGMLYEKITITAHPDAFPAMKINTATPAGTCTLSIDPAFSVYTAKESVLESEAEMILTIFPDLDIFSLWISALDHTDDYSDSRFLLNTGLSCSNEEKNVKAISVGNNMPVLNENGIFTVNFGQFLQEADNFFSGDLDGDDDYETISGEEYFEFQSSENL